jgi:uncharacterized damage-inducible protein DinB
MDTRERQQLLESLETGRNALTAAVSGLADEAAAKSPAPGRWSVLECVEHLCLVEDYLFAQIAASTPSETPVGSRSRENSILRRGADRRRPLEAPEVARPTGRFQTLAEALSAFASSRARTIAYVQGLQEDPRMRTAHHPLIGDVNCHETLLIMAIHPQRHIGQILEIRAALAAAR